MGLFSKILMQDSGIRILGMQKLYYCVFHTVLLISERSTEYMNHFYVIKIISSEEFYFLLLIFRELHLKRNKPKTASEMVANYRGLKESLLNQDREKFMNFIENKTGITWQVQKSIFAINIRDILNYKQK